MKDTFSTFHPVVNIVYFIGTIGFAMFMMQPICMLISFSSALIYANYIRGRKATYNHMKIILPMIIISGVLNPIFNHEGGTVLIYLKDGNPLTLESIAFGIATAVMIGTVILWFSCYNYVMTSDKFIYLFGRIIPALSLIISMALRLVPRFKSQLRIIINAQRNMGRDVNLGSVFSRIKNGLKILSILITWALEDTIETGDSMKSRGYGLLGRTSFSIYTFDKRDKLVLAFLIINISMIMIGIYFKGIYFRYFPTLKGDWLSAYAIGIYIHYTLFLNAPIIHNIWEDKKWKALKSKI